MAWSLTGCLGLRYLLARGVWGLWQDSSAGVRVSRPRQMVVKGWSELQDYSNHHLFLSLSSLFLCVQLGYNTWMGASWCTLTPLPIGSPKTNTMDVIHTYVPRAANKGGMAKGWRFSFQDRSPNPYPSPTTFGPKSALPRCASCDDKVLRMTIRPPLGTPYRHKFRLIRLCLLYMPFHVPSRVC